MKQNNKTQKSNSTTGDDPIKGSNPNVPTTMNLTERESEKKINSEDLMDIDDDDETSEAPPLNDYNSDDDSDDGVARRKEVVIKVLDDLERQYVETLTEKFDMQGCAYAIPMLRDGLIKIGNSSVEMENLFKNEPCHSFSWMTKMERLRDSPTTNQGRIKVRYYQPLMPGTHIPFMRKSAQGVCSQTMPRKLRSLLFGKYYFDLDIENAWPCIIAGAFPDDTKMLQSYIRKKDEWRKQVMDIHKVDKDDAKTLFLTMISMKNPKSMYRSWCNAKVDDRTGKVVRSTLKQNIKLKTKCLKLARELIDVREKILLKNEDFCFQEKSKGKKKVHKGCCLNKWCQEQEARALEIIRRVLVENGQTVGAQIADGCHSEKSYVLVQSEQVIKKKKTEIANLKSIMDSALQLPGSVTVEGNRERMANWKQKLGELESTLELNQATVKAETTKVQDIAVIVSEELQKHVGFEFLSVVIKPFKKVDTTGVVPEHRHPFNSCAAGDPKVVTIDEISDELDRMTNITYDSSAHFYRELDKVCIHKMNFCMARLNVGCNQGGAKILLREWGRKKMVVRTCIREVKYTEYKKRSLIDAYHPELKKSFKWKQPKKKKKTETKTEEEEEEVVRRKINVLEYFLSDFKSLKYTNKRFNPRPLDSDESPPTDELNTYTGLAVTLSDKDLNTCKEKCKPLLDHIKNIWAKGNEDLYNYILDWIAHVIQRPHEKTGVALVILGEKGSGKGIVVDFLLKIIGQHAAEVTAGHHITGNFNALLNEKILVVLNEATWSGDKQAAGVQKGLITDQFQTVRKMYCDAEVRESFLNMMYCSNNEEAVAIQAGQRRFTVVETHNKYAGVQTAETKVYFDKILAVDKGCFLKVMLNRDLSNVNLRAIPYTTAMQNQIENSMNTVQQYVLGLLRGQITVPNCVVERGAQNEPGMYVDKPIFGETKQYIDRVKFYQHYKGMYNGRLAARAAETAVKFWKFICNMSPENGCAIDIPMFVSTPVLDEDKNPILIEGKPKMKKKPATDSIAVSKGYIGYGTSENVRCLVFPTLQDALLSFQTHIGGSKLFDMKVN